MLREEPHSRSRETTGAPVVFSDQTSVFHSISFLWAGAHTTFGVGRRRATRDFPEFITTDVTLQSNYSMLRAFAV